MPVIYGLVRILHRDTRRPDIGDRWVKEITGFEKTFGFVYTFKMDEAKQFTQTEAEAAILGRNANWQHKGDVFEIVEVRPPSEVWNEFEEHGL